MNFNKLFNRKVIEKLEKMDFNKLSNEQYKKLDEILKLKGFNYD